MNNEIKRIMIVFSVICLSLVVLIGYLTYFEIFRANKIKINSYNKRLWINEEGIERGSILDRSGKVLVESKLNEDKTITRDYKYPSLYSHVIGYSNRVYGKTGLEQTYNKYLLNTSNSMTLNDFKDIINNNNRGNDLKLTIDHGLQDKTRQEMSGRKGSVIISNPKTGEIYSMVSLPDFNVMEIDNIWRDISTSTNSPLLNRSTQGVYTPGSVFKIVTTAALLENNLDESYKCLGDIKIDGYTFKDYSGKGHGNLDLRGGFTKSCNTYFINQGTKLKEKDLIKTMEDFYINKDIKMDIPTSKSTFPRDSIGKTEFAASTIGQGKLGLTPLNMLLITSTVANDGNYKEFVLVDEFIYNSGKIVENSKSNSEKIIDKEVAKEIQSMMLDVVEVGTGKNARSNKVKIAGKTGTAENASGKSHSWFTGFAPYEDPKFAIVVVFEEDGRTGGSSAAPVAKSLLEYAVKNIK